MRTKSPEHFACPQVVAPVASTCYEPSAASLASLLLVAGVHLPTIPASVSSALPASGDGEQAVGGAECRVQFRPSVLREQREGVQWQVSHTRWEANGARI